jgi:hypothetical protein
MQRFLLERKGSNAKTSQRPVSGLTWKGQEQVGPVFGLVRPSADHCSGRSMDRVSLGLALCGEPCELGLHQPLSQHYKEMTLVQDSCGGERYREFGSDKKRLKREALETEAPFQGAVPLGCWT